MGFTKFHPYRPYFYLALAVLAGGLHALAVTPYFLWDDFTLIVKNEALRENPFSALYSPLFNRADAFYFRPLPFFIFGLIGHFAGVASAAAFHAVSVLFGTLASLVFFRVAELYLPIERAFLVAVAFTFFPTNVEAIAWVSAFPDLLVACFALLFFYRLWFEVENRRPSPWLMLIAAAALFSKEGGVLLFPFAVFADFNAIKAKPFSRLLRFHGPLWLVFAVYYLIHSLVAKGEVLAGLGGSQTIPSTFGRYLYHIVSPWPLSILQNDFSAHWDTAAVWGLAGLIAVIALLLFTRNKPLRFSAAFLLAAFIPYSQFWAIPSEYSIAERFMVPMVAAALLILSVALRSFRNWQFASFMLVLITAYGITSYSRYAEWQAPIAFWQNTAELRPDSFYAFTRLGSALAKSGDRYGSEKAYARAIENQRSYRYPAGIRNSVVSDVYSIHAALLSEQGRYEEALDDLRTSFAVEQAASTAVRGIVTLDILMRFDDALAAAIKAHDRFPKSLAIAERLISLAALSGRASVAASAATTPTLKKLMAQRQSEYDSLTTMPTLHRAGVYLRNNIISLAFSEFAKAATSMTADQLAAVGRIAVVNRLWNPAMRYYGLAFEKQPKPNWWAEFQMAGFLVDQGVNCDALVDTPLDGLEPSTRRRLVELLNRCARVPHDAHSR